MDLVNITVFTIFVLVLLYKNWIPGIETWVHDRMHS